MTNEQKGMERRKFLKIAGIGSAALASLGVASFASGTIKGQQELEKPSSLVTRSSQTADPPLANYLFLVISFGPKVGSVQHAIVVGGNGSIGSSEVTGGGGFVHFDAASAIPQTILGGGTWLPKRLLSFNTIGSWGSHAYAGIVEMEVDIIRETPSPAVRGATLKHVCNLGPAGLHTGLKEGVYIDIPTVGIKFEPIEIATKDFPAPAVPYGITVLTRPG